MRKLLVFFSLISLVILIVMDPIAGRAQVAEETETFAVYLPLVARNYPEFKLEGPEWLVQINQYRLNAGLPLLEENTAWSNGAQLHSRYMVKNDVIQHFEDPANPWYTSEGATAAQTSNLVVSSLFATSDQQAIDVWMAGPFHAVGIMDPGLTTVGYGSFRELDSSPFGLEMGAGLDVLRGLGGVPASVEFPIMWPADGETVTLTSHRVELPDPLTSCSGYAAPVGLPVVLQIGDGRLTPNVTAHSFREGGINLAHCVFDETNYANPNGQHRSLGRNILGSRDAVVLIPRNPLTPGASYTASISVSGQTYSWTFTVSDTAAVISLSTGDRHGLQEFDSGRYESIEMAAAWIN